MKPGCHKKITARAVDLYCAHRDDSFAGLLRRFRGSIVDGSVDADTTPFTTRATNWHFFRENDRLQPIKVHLLGIMPLTIHPTSDHIFRQREAELEREMHKGDHDDLFHLIGRLLHHTQDMSTPAHVVPVYHGLDVVDIVPDAINVHDSFEEYSQDVIDMVLESLDIDDATFRTVTAESHASLIDIYNRAAHQTLEDLYAGPLSSLQCSVDGHATAIGWSKFWERNNPALNDEQSQRGFGRYGELGTHFGDTDISVRGHRYQIPATAYLAFYSHLLRKMLHDSIRLLAAVERRHA